MEAWVGFDEDFSFRCNFKLKRICMFGIVAVNLEADTVQVEVRLVAIALNEFSMVILLYCKCIIATETTVQFGVHGGIY